MNVQNFKVLGVQLSVLNYQNVLDFVDQAILKKKCVYICVSAVHLIMECQFDERLKAGINKASLVTTDGMPLVWLGKYLGYKDIERVYGPTFTLKLCQLAQKKKYKVFLLGGAKGQDKELKKQLERQLPNIQVVGTQATPQRVFSNTLNQQILNKINRLKADIVLVGLGCPFQEKWMIENRNNVKASVLVGVGAAFNFITGKVTQAPVWMQNAGLEWLFRLIHEPRRLWYRYIVLNSLFIWKILTQRDSVQVNR